MSESASRTLRGADVLALQRAIGNRSAQRVMASPQVEVAPRPEVVGRVSAVQRSLPSLEAFKESTNAGLFATRDALLKEIDSVLASCHNLRITDADEQWLASGAEIPERAQESIRRGRVRYSHELGVLQNLIQGWLNVTAKDTSEAVVARRRAIENLQREVNREMQMRPEDRVAEIVERNEAASRVKRALFSVDGFKTASGAGVVESRVGPVSEIMDALAAYHALPVDTPSEKVRDTKIAALATLQGVAGDASRGLGALMSRPGYEKGHMGYQKEAHQKMREAIWALIKQISDERKRVSSVDEAAPASRGEGDWEVVE